MSDVVGYVPSFNADVNAAEALDDLVSDVVVGLAFFALESFDADSKPSAVLFLLVCLELERSDAVVRTFSQLVDVPVNGPRPGSQIIGGSFHHIFRPECALSLRKHVKPRLAFYRKSIQWLSYY